MTSRQVRQFAFRRPVTTVIGVASLVGLAFLYLAPALRHGTSLGPFDFLSTFGLTATPNVKPYNLVALDQIAQGQPWTALDWTQVHSGHLPLWNPFSAMGTPLAFNFQSAPFSLPTMVGYLLPVRYAYTVAVLVKMIIAGTGVMFLCRVLRLSNLASVFAGAVFELSGSFTGWLGWPQATAMSFLGWVIAATVLLLEQRPGRSRARAVTLLALVLTLCVYAGHPESMVMIFGAVAIVALVYLAAAVMRIRRASSNERSRGLRTVMAPFGELVLGVVLSLALAAPLLLPGASVVANASRQVSIDYTGLSREYLVNLVAPGYFGFPITTSVSYGRAAYYEAANYVGVIALILAVTAVVCCWRRRATVALAAIAAICTALLFVPPFAHFVGSLPVLKDVAWGRVAMPLDLALASLAGLGLQQMRAHPYSRRTLYGLGLAVATATAFLLLIFLKHQRDMTSAAERTAESKSLVMPLVCLLLSALVLGALAILSRAQPAGYTVMLRRLGPETACVALVVVEVVFLLTATPNLWASSNTFFAQTAGEQWLKSEVGNARVGMANCAGLTADPGDIGVLPDDNDYYGISELAVYDPVLSQQYYDSWARLTHTPIAHSALGMFCPDLTNPSLARYYGVSYVLATASDPTLTGMRFVGLDHSEKLYRVPGGGVMTLEEKGAAPDRADETVVGVQYPSPSSMRAVVMADRPSTLYVHVTDEPGWHMTIDGRPVTFQRWDDLMMTVDVPPGRHVIELTYLPASFLAGIVCAVIVAAALLAWMLWERHRFPGIRLFADRRPATDSATPGSSGPSRVWLDQVSDGDPLTPGASRPVDVS